MNRAELQNLSQALAPLNLEERLCLLVNTFGQHMAFSTSLGKEDQAIAHAIFSQDLPIRVFTLDTGRLFEATHSVLSATRERYGAVIETYLPQTDLLQNLLNSKGPNSFYDSVENRLECCYVRKVEPLNRALQGASAWITGLRSQQSESRAQLPFMDWDVDRQRLKVNPILDWSDDQLDQYIKANNVPINRLHAQGYPSIGCAPCTRPVPPQADPRSGRWWWENPNPKECGLHLSQPVSSLRGS